tara:strand:+ start:346 stop:525 length:180 start_codon:yes stop_codon:yes gene_type:complete
MQFWTPWREREANAIISLVVILEEPSESTLKANAIATIFSEVPNRSDLIKAARRNSLFS